MKNKLITIVVAIIAAGAIGFYGGIKYHASKAGPSGPGGGGFANLTPAERQARLSERGGSTFGGQGRGVNFTSGEIIAKDDKSITVKLRDGSSKIVFFSSTTQMDKLASAGASDLLTGKQVTITGDTNADGSITAKNIQIRPAMPTNSPATNNPPANP